MPVFYFLSFRQIFIGSRFVTALSMKYLHFVLCSAAGRKPNETIKIILTTFLGVAFGFLIGVSFPTLSLTKVCKFRSAFSLSCMIFPFFSFPFFFGVFFCSHYVDEYPI
jgi:hypothetical protein